MAYENFIPEIWSARLLEHLNKTHVFANLMNRDYEGEIRSMGDTVHINQIGDVTIKTYDGSDIDDPEELDSEQQVLKIDQGKYFNFQIKDIDNAQTNPKLMDAAMQRAAYGMNDAVDQYIAGQLIDGAGNTVTGDISAASDAYEALVDMGTKLTEANIAMPGRWAVVTPAFYGYLLKDDRFVGYGTAPNVSNLTNGQVGSAAGFVIYVSNNCTVDAIAGTDIAGSFAEQLVEMEPYRLEKNFSDAVKGLHVFGSKVLIPEALVVLGGTSPDSAKPLNTTADTATATSAKSKKS